MANFRRKRNRKAVRCTLCTNHRWLGNAKGRFKAKDEKLLNPKYPNPEPR